MQHCQTNAWRLLREQTVCVGAWLFSERTPCSRFAASVLGFVHTRKVLEAPERSALKLQHKSYRTGGAVLAGGGGHLRRSDSVPPLKVTIKTRSPVTFTASTLCCRGRTRRLSFCSIHQSRSSLL